MQGQGKAMERGESLCLQNLDIKTPPAVWGLSEKQWTQPELTLTIWKPTKHLSKNTETVAAVLGSASVN